MEETKTRIDGRKEMSRNPKPKKYFVVRNRKTGEAIEAYKPEELSQVERIKLVRDHIRSEKTTCVAEYFKDEKAFTENTGLTFESDEVDN